MQQSVRTQKGIVLYMEAHIYAIIFTELSFKHSVVSSSGSYFILRSFEEIKVYGF